MRRYRHGSYEAYRLGQIRANERKFSRVFISEEDVEVIASRVPRPVAFGICHGVRNGWEVRAFRRALGAGALIGTDISPSAAGVEGCIVWDFHEVDPAWLGRCDFIYSNALDHSYDPELCLDRWMSCLSPRGVCVINWHKSRFARLGRADCFVATTREIEALLGRCEICDRVRTRTGTNYFLRRRSGRRARAA